MYVFTSLGERIDPCSLSVVYNEDAINEDDSAALEMFAEKRGRVYFKPQQLQNLEICDEYLPSLAPIMKMTLRFARKARVDFTLSVEVQDQLCVFLKSVWKRRS